MPTKVKERKPKPKAPERVRDGRTGSASRAWWNQNPIWRDGARHGRRPLSSPVYRALQGSVGHPPPVKRNYREGKKASERMIW